MNLLPALALATLISDDACSARLDQLLVIYREYGLPLPPPDAPLIRTAAYPGAFLVIRLLSRDEEAKYEFHGESFAVVKPDPVALGSAVEYAGLHFAIKCHERGWRPLARAAFRKWLVKPQLLLVAPPPLHLDFYASGERLWQVEKARAERQLACDAWTYWLDQLSKGAPLTVVAKHLKRALPHTGYMDDAKVALLRSLDLSLAPSHSVPGSDESLIDELLEERYSWVENSSAYCALARRGFAAIPALIAHLGDDRLTRFEGGRGRFLRVKDVVYGLICAFAGEKLETSNDIADRTFAVGKWFADAQQMGEEEYVVSRVIKEKVSQAGSVLFPILIEKYPKRLPEVYRRFIDSQESEFNYSESYAKAIAEAPIPLADQLKILEYAATSTEPTHRLAGLRYLRRLDPKRGNELLIAALDRLEQHVAWGEIWLAELVLEGSDPAAWTALARAAKRVSTETRVSFFCTFWWANKSTPTNRALQLAFIASHLTDTDVCDMLDHRIMFVGFGLERGFKQSEVRNYAATKLAQMLGFEDEPKCDWTTAQWARFRERVRHALEHDARR